MSPSITRRSGRAGDPLRRHELWSLALRTDRESARTAAEVVALKNALEGGQTVVTTGLILQELLQGFSGPLARKEIIERFNALPVLMPDRQDHIDAAELRNRCRRSGVQVATIDTVLAQIAIRHELMLLTTDKDFRRMAAHSPLRLWGQG